MQDAFGKELSIGDEVVYISGVGGDHFLKRGIIVGFDTDKYYYYRVKINGYGAKRIGNVLSSRVAKL